MARLHIDYDLLSWEGDILRLQFWATAFDILKRNGTVYLQPDGKLKGCWVMEIDEDVDATVEQADAADAAEGEEEADAEGGPNQREKVIVRSDGTVTYVGKDIANQFWKFGLLGKDFLYRPFATRIDGDTLWATTSTDGEADAPRLRRRRHGDQRHRHAPVLPAEVAEAGARHDGASHAGRAVDPLLVRDGGPVAQDGA